MWLVEYWEIILSLIVLLVVLALKFKVFSNLPNETQIAQVKEWLLYAVTLAEKDFETGTGQIKLRYVYDLFISKFSFAMVFSFEKFSSLVDEALEEMKKMLETNNKMVEYVEGAKTE